MIDEILKHNREFVNTKAYEQFATSKYPDKRIAVVTCMDTRLTHLLPAALGIKNGDVKMIKNAGGTITNPFDSTMRSLLIAIYELGVNEVMVIGHTGCGVQGMDSGHMLQLMRDRGIDDEHISDATLRYRPRQLAARIRRHGSRRGGNRGLSTQPPVDAPRHHRARFHHRFPHRIAISYGITSFVDKNDRTFWQPPVLYF